MDLDDNFDTSSWLNFFCKRDTTLKYNQDLTGVENATSRNMTQLIILLKIDNKKKEVETCQGKLVCKPSQSGI